MNLPAHTIKCYPPSMNLPVHGTTSPDPSVASLLKITHKQTMDRNIIVWRSLHAARRNRSKLPGDTFPPPDASAFPAPLFFSHRLAEHTLPPGATRCKDL